MCNGAAFYLFTYLFIDLFSIKVGEFNPAFDRFLKFVKGIKYKGHFCLLMIRYIVYLM